MIRKRIAVLGGYFISSEVAVRVPLDTKLEHYAGAVFVVDPEVDLRNLELYLQRVMQPHYRGCVCRIVVDKNVEMSGALRYLIHQCYWKERCSDTIEEAVMTLINQLRLAPETTAEETTVVVFA